MGSEPRAASLAGLAGNPAIRTLFGDPVALDDAGGFTVWRTGAVVAVLLGVWGLLAATRTTRGEEDAGRWICCSSAAADVPGRPPSARRPAGEHDGSRGGDRLGPGRRRD